MCRDLKAGFALAAVFAAAGAQGLEADPLPDPTLPPRLHQAAVQRLAQTRQTQYAVTAIKISGEDRKAIVNGQLLSEGARIGSAVLVEIGPGAIVIEHLSERQRYRLLPYDVRHPPGNPSVEE